MATCTTSTAGTTDLIQLPMVSAGPLRDPSGTHPGLLFYAFLAPPAPQPPREQTLPRVGRRQRKARISDPCVSVCIRGFNRFALPTDFAKRRHRRARISDPCVSV